MANYSIPYLCGGIFFTLLSQVKQQGTARDKLNNTYKGISDPDLMAGLIHVITNSALDTFTGAGGFNKDVSRYKNCTFKGGKNVPLNQSAVISAFDYEIKNQYNLILNRMIDYTQAYLKSDEGTMNWLVNLLISVIVSDESIDDNSEFVITKNQDFTIKKNLLACPIIEFQPFLLGVLHFIITKPTFNIEGKATFASLYPDRENHTEGTFNDSFINKVEASFTIKNLQKEKEPAANTQQTHENTSNPEVEYIDGSSNPHTQIINQHIDHPTIVNQTGEKNIHIDHVENLKI